MTAAKVDLAALARRDAFGAVEISRSSQLAHFRVDVVRGDGRLVAGLTGTAFANGTPLEV